MRSACSGNSHLSSWNGFIYIGTKTGDVGKFFFLSLALSKSYVQLVLCSPFSVIAPADFLFYQVFYNFIICAVMILIFEELFKRQNKFLEVVFKLVTILQWKVPKIHFDDMLESS